MERRKIPTIKGMFVNSHIKILRRRKGDDAVRELEKRYRAPLHFRPMQEVPVREEVKIIEHVLDLLSDKPGPPHQRAFEAGRLHFRNFSTTVYGRMLLSVFPRNFKTAMLATPNIAVYVFKNVEFSVKETGKKSVTLLMGNNDYPLEHFQGFFSEWMSYLKFRGQVNASEMEPNVFEYKMQWK